MGSLLAIPSSPVRVEVEEVETRTESVEKIIMYL
jgi:hypothetical protein